MKVVYCGFGRAGLECFYQLLNTMGIEPNQIIVFTHEADENRSFTEQLNNLGVKFYYDSINKHIDDVIQFSPDIILSVYYRFIIKSELLQLVDYKAMNLHPSLLPAYRGTKSSVWALINGEKETGVSFHYINEEIDDGKIIIQEKLHISESDTAYSLYNKLISLFIKNFDKAMNRLIDEFEGDHQHGTVSYYKRELPFGGVKNFSECTYSEAKQFVKAMYFPPYSGAYFTNQYGNRIEVNSVDELKKYEPLFKDNK